MTDTGTPTAITATQKQPSSSSSSSSDSFLATIAALRSRISKKRKKPSSSNENDGGVMDTPNNADELLDKLKRELAECRAALTSTRMSQSAIGRSLERDIGTKNKDLLKISNVVDKLKGSKAELEDQLQRLKDQLESNQALRATMAEALDSVKAELATEKSCIAEKNKVIDSLSRDLSHFRSLATEKKSELASSTAILEDREKECKRLALEVSEVKAVSDRLTKELDEAKGDMKNYVDQLSVQRENLEAKESELEAMQEALNTTRKTLDEQKSMNRMLELREEKLIIEKKSLYDNVEELTAELEQKHTENGNLMDTISTNRKDFEEQLDTMRDVIEDLTQSNEILDKEVVELRDECKAADVEREKLVADKNLYETLYSKATAQNKRASSEKVENETRSTNESSPKPDDEKLVATKHAGIEKVMKDVDEKEEEGDGGNDNDDDSTVSGGEVQKEQVDTSVQSLPSKDKGFSEDQKLSPVNENLEDEEMKSDNANYDSMNVDAESKSEEENINSKENDKDNRGSSAYDNSVNEGEVEDHVDEENSVEKDDNKVEESHLKNIEGNESNYIADTYGKQLTSSQQSITDAKQSGCEDMQVDVNGNSDEADSRADTDDRASGDDEDNRANESNNGKYIDDEGSESDCEGMQVEENENSNEEENDADTDEQASNDDEQSEGDRADESLDIGDADIHSSADEDEDELEVIEILD